MTLTTIKTYLRSSVAKNAASLYVIQFSNYLLPMITVPYVVRVLGPSGYGVVSFGQSLVGYFLVFIGYGFVFSATRKISVERFDSEMLSSTAFNVWGAKLLLAFVGFIVLILLAQLVPMLKENRGLLFILYGLVLGDVLFPTWLFQGMERMVPISVINLIIRLFVILGIFTLIKRPEDYLLYAGLNSVGAIVAGVFGVAVAFFMFPLRPLMPSWLGIWTALKEGWMLFLSQASVSLYTVGNSFILGMLTSLTVVGYYSAAEKIVKAVLCLTGPIAQAAYPRFSKMACDSRDLALQWGRHMLVWTGGAGLLLSASLFVLAPFIVKVVLGPQYEPSIMVIRIIALLPVLVAVSNVFGIQIMLPFGKDTLFAITLLTAGLINLLLSLLLAPVYQASGMAIAVLCSEVFVTSSMSAILWTYGLNPLFNSGRAYSRKHGIKGQL